MTQTSKFKDMFHYQDELFAVPDGYTSIFLDLHDEVSARQLAWSYAKASLQVLETARKAPEVPQMAFPALFLVRHTIELFVKGMVPDEPPSKKQRTHRLDVKLQILKDKMRKEHDAIALDDLFGLLMQFQKLDPVSMEFRYKDGASDIKEGEKYSFVDLNALSLALPRVFAFLEFQWAKYESRDAQIAAMELEAEALDFDFSELKADFGISGET